MNENGLNYIDLFAGAGGLSEGFIQSGYRPVAHVEMNEHAAKTIETRIAYYYLKDIGKIKSYYDYEKGKITREQLLEKIPKEELKTVINKEMSEATIKGIFNTIDDIKREKEIDKIDVIIGGPPCQAYSLVGRAQSSHMIVPMEDDPRNELYKMYVQFLKKYKPRMFVFENVAGIKTARGGQAFKNLQTYMKRVGWDVNNLFTIIPLNAAKSDILALQTIGRGLRLPFGEITGIEELDTLDIVAHDHYREIVDDIKNNPVFKKRNLDEEDIPNTKTVMVEPAVENQQISLFDEALCESKVKSYQDLNNENVVENLFAEYQKAFVKKVAPKKSESDSGQMSIFDYFANDDEKETNDGTASEHKMTQTGMGTDAVDTSFTVHQGDASLQIDLQKSSGSKNVLPYAKQEFIKKVEELKKVAISVPKIGISYSSTITFKSFTVKRNIMDFDVAASRIERYDAVNGKLLQVLDADALIVENPENMLAVSLLESIPEFSSDDAEFILEVVDQYLALIEGTDEEKKKIVRRYATVIVEDLRKQIYASKEESTEFVFNVQKDLIVFKSFAKNMKENGRLNFKKEVPDKKNIKQYLFEGYKKSYYAENAFDSDDERRLSVVLEEDSEVIRFIKPPLNQLGLFYKAAKQYNPDFLVETADKKYMIEVKAANQTDNEDVQEKAKAAIKWCECASQVDADGKTWEYRLVPGDKIIVGNTFKYVIGMAIHVVVDGE